MAYDPQRYRSAIARIESGGRYNAVGPTDKRMGRALGKYQIMEANIGPWSQEALGRTITPDEFLANPQYQDAIFDHKFGSYVSQFGPEGAAQAWFAGPGGVGKVNRKDVLGTDVGSYGRKFMQGLGADPYANMPDGPKGQEVYAPSVDNSSVASIWGNGAAPNANPGYVDPALLRDKEKSPLQGILGALSEIGNGPSHARMGPMGDARESADGLLKYLSGGGNPLAQFAMKQRGILG